MQVLGSKWQKGKRVNKELEGRNGTIRGHKHPYHREAEKTVTPCLAGDQGVKKNGGVGGQERREERRNFGRGFEHPGRPLHGLQ